LAQIGRLVASTSSKSAVTAPLTQVMDGMSQYGVGMIDLWSARASVLTLTRVPVKEQLAGLWASLQPAGEGGTRQQGLSYGSSAMSGWSRFAYKALSTIAREVARRALDQTRPDEALTAVKVFKLVWATLYDLKDEFETTITSKNRLGCAGLRLIMGVDNPWATLLYHQCAASAELTKGLQGLALDLFVQIPMAKCICKDSSGGDVAAFAIGTCATGLPVALLPTLYMIANEIQYGGVSGSLYNSFTELRCAAVLTSVRASIAGSLDAWFENQHLALRALGSSMDYALASFDENAGDCLNFADDPHTVVLVPQPVDYFQRCAGTSMCRNSKCADQWRQFQSALKPGATYGKTSLSVTTESSFFPGSPDATLALVGTAVAAVEIPTARGVCLPRARTNPPDYALAVAELVGAGLWVRFWCAPLMGSAGVYRNVSSAYGPVDLPGSVLSAQFGDDTGEWVAALVQPPGGAQQRVVVVNRTGVFEAPGWDDRMARTQVLMRVENMWVVEGAILVDLVTRHVVASGGTGGMNMGLDALSEVMHVFLQPPLGIIQTNATTSGLWHGTDVDLMPFGGGQYGYTRVAPSKDYLFMPKREGTMMLLHRVRLAVVPGDTAKRLWLRQDASEPLQVAAGLGGLSGTVMAAATQGKGYVFSVAAGGGEWDWLRQTRFDEQGYVLGVYGSAEVEIQTDIEGRCDELSCEGCTTLGVQRLCHAYAQCALINCVGTPVHQTRPLCGIGGLLKHHGEMSLRSTHGAWTVFTEMLGLGLELHLLTVQEAHLLWPDDSFLCYVCEAKDATAQFFSILTATVNSALQAGGANMAYLYGGASNVASNADAALTISSSALNGFMHQAALMPLFAMIASRQIMMCQVRLDLFQVLG
jgi:hypothetical protein